MIELDQARNIGRRTGYYDLERYKNGRVYREISHFRYNGYGIHLMVDEEFYDTNSNLDSSLYYIVTSPEGKVVCEDIKTLGFAYRLIDHDVKDQKIKKLRPKELNAIVVPTRKKRDDIYDSLLYAYQRQNELQVTHMDPTEVQKWFTVDKGENEMKTERDETIKNTFELDRHFDNVDRAICYFKDLEAMDMFRFVEDKEKTVYMVVDGKTCKASVPVKDEKTTDNIIFYVSLSDGRLCYTKKSDTNPLYVYDPRGIVISIGRFIDENQVSEKAYKDECCGNCTYYIPSKGNRGYGTCSCYEYKVKAIFSPADYSCKDFKPIIPIELNRNSTQVNYILDELDKIDNKIIDLAEMDAFGDYQMGRRDGLWRAHDLVGGLLLNLRKGL